MSSVVPVLPTGTRVVSGTGSVLVGVPSHVSQLAVMLDVTAVSGTTPLLDVTVEWSVDGITWFVAEPAQAFAQVSAVAARVKQVPVLANGLRVRWVIAGTTPSFTFSVNYWMPV